jgi:hypothetical protein
MVSFDEEDRFNGADAGGGRNADPDIELEGGGRTVTRRAVTGDAVTDHVIQPAPLPPSLSFSPSPSLSLCEPA